MACGAAAEEEAEAEAEAEGGFLSIGDGLFADTFCEDRVYRFGGEEVKISQVFSARLGMAAPVWDAALHLCRYFEDRRLELRGKRVIELGAGTGVVGILAARLGRTRSLSELVDKRGSVLFHGAEVTLTDLPLAIPQLQNNVFSNTPASGWPSAPPSVLPLSWGVDQLGFRSDWDLVLGADIVYLAETYPLLLQTLVHLCQSGAVAYLSSKMRREHATPGFYEDSLPKRFHVECVHRNVKHDINIYKAFLRREL